ncbi:hypothetical protein K438DRAFT_1775110 [Mycena galopus ATCC 62051]|nr:hypothetical protein K438DRAFT_1775110 [Mycena galopus ATCC 62051]
MPHAGTAKRQREQAGLPPIKPGRRGWVYGSKLEFFRAHKDTFIAAAVLGKSGNFYSEVGQLYLDKYGYHSGWNEDLPKGQDVADDVDPTVDYGGGVHKKNEKIKTFRQLFDKRELDPPAPVRPRILHFYSNHFYHERIKPCGVARWQALLRQTHSKPPVLVQVQTQLALEKEHMAVQEAYTIAMAKEAPATAEEYNVALNNMAYYLQPFAEAACRQFAEKECRERGLPESSAPSSRAASPNSSEDGGAGGELSRAASPDDKDGANGGPARTAALPLLHPSLPPPPPPPALGPLGGDEENNELLLRGPTLRMSPFLSTPIITTTSLPGDDMELFPVIPSDEGSWGDGVLNGGWAGWDGQDMYVAKGEYQGPVIGQALGDKIAALDPVVRLAYMGTLGAMSREDVDWENAYAESRASLRSGTLPQTPDPLETVETERLEGEGEGAPPVPTRPKPKPMWKGKKAEVAEKMVEAKGDGDGEEEPDTKDGDDAEDGEDTEDGEDADGERVEGGEVVIDVKAMWTQLEVDQKTWPEELKLVFTAFKRLEDCSGEQWGFCVESLIALERAWGFPEKGLLPAPQGEKTERPEEVLNFMQPTDEGTFGDRWWRWWLGAQPEERTLPSGKYMAALLVPEDVWKESAVSKMAGKNGALLYVGALLWWGEAAAIEEERALKEWISAAADVGLVQTTEAPLRSSKRKKVDSPSDKANEAPQDKIEWASEKIRTKI